MNTKSAVLTAMLLMFTEVYASTKCDSFENVKISVTPRDADPYETTVNGCIERVAFNTTVLETYVKRQSIPRLGVDAVKNMKHLHSVTFDGCGVQVVEPGAFRNVPNLKSIRIVNGDLAVVRSGVFNVVPNLYVLKLHRNKIELVEDGAFSGLPTLRKLYMGNNKLKRWRRDWFGNTTDIEILDFRFNNIAALPARAFSDFPRIKELNFDYNELETVGHDALKGVTQLEYFGLKYNRLRSLDSDVFPNDITIKLMSIDANYLNFISSKILAKLSVQVLTLSGNPWKCPCLEQLLLWLHESNSTLGANDTCTRSAVPVCSFATSFPRSCTETIDDSVTITYLDELKRVVPPLEKFCARLD